jgi:hypothetical protein
LFSNELQIIFVSKRRIKDLWNKETQEYDISSFKKVNTYISYEEEGDYMQGKTNINIRCLSYMMNQNV